MHRAPRRRGRSHWAGWRPRIIDPAGAVTVLADLHYGENWSPVQDFVILLRTVKAVVTEEGAH